MSFILDALKKSESDRQRQSGPALFEVKVAPPRPRLPAWAIAIAALLVVNLGIVMWMLLRHSTRAAGADAATSAATPAATAATASWPAQPLAVPAAAALPPAAPAPGSAPVVTAAGSAVPPAMSQPLAADAAAAAAAAATPSPAPAPAPSVPGGTAAAAADAPNPEDYAPAAEQGSPALGSRVRRGTAAGVPLYQDAAATPGTHIPELRLDLHVFAAQPQDRFVMINMHKLREGESLPEGVHVDSITPDGVVLSYKGSRFLLTQN